MDKQNHKIAYDTYRPKSRDSALAFLLGICTKKPSSHQKKYPNSRTSSRFSVTVKSKTNKHNQRKFNYFNPKLAYQQLKISQSPYRIHTMRNSLSDLPVSKSEKDENGNKFNNFLVISTKQLSGHNTKAKTRSQQVLCMEDTSKTRDTNCYKRNTPKRSQSVFKEVEAKQIKNKVDELNNTDIVGW
ncbi:hypothetical protein SteCoe_23607 [Stentor coeruleus]|uniref:Uncharacterized protein n=1 Tax=Stentor coeruleus TaxID=5963 RepID=A0A1R2BJW7_9CILI|nr:hypothetical protein SteCoe_23607 [Stentor coeruleus]